MAAPTFVAMTHLPALPKWIIFPVLLFLLLFGTNEKSIAGYYVSIGDTTIKAPASITDTPRHVRTHITKVNDTAGLARRAIPRPNAGMSAILLTASVVSVGCLVVAVALAAWLLLIPWLVLAIGVMLRVGGFYTHKVMHRAACWAFDIAFAATMGLVLGSFALVTACAVAALWPFHALGNLFTKKENRKDMWGNNKYRKSKKSD